jgi:hypothetical protein
MLSKYRTNNSPTPTTTDKMKMTTRSSVIVKPDRFADMGSTSEYLTELDEGQGQHSILVEGRSLPEFDQL